MKEIEVGSHVIVRPCKSLRFGGREGVVVEINYNDVVPLSIAFDDVFAYHFDFDEVFLTTDKDVPCRETRVDPTGEYYFICDNCDLGNVICGVG